MKTIYLGMALRGAPSWWTSEFQTQVRQQLSHIDNLEVTQFIGLKDVSPSHIYRNDITLAKSADLMVALTRFTSLGLGMEIQARSDQGLPTIVLHPESEVLSGMVLGAPHVTVVNYVSGDIDGVEQANVVAKTVRKFI